MTPKELAADLRSRINPKYDNQKGCESYLNRGCAEAIESLIAENAKLRDALKNLLEDTQHAEHEDCEDGPCPVREARAALEKNHD